MTEETPEWTEDEIQALLHLVHVPKSGTLTSRIDFAMREMKYYNSNFPVRPMYECREKYYENITKKCSNLSYWLSKVEAIAYTCIQLHSSFI